MKTPLQKLWSHAPHEVRKKVLAVFLCVLLLTGAVWGYTVFLWHAYPLLFGLVTLAYGLGLRHAVDADHITAIDTTTRKLMLDGKQPVGVGFFFSLGHSTIVILLSLWVAFSAAYVNHSLPVLQQTGAIIGTSISSFFLLIMGAINLLVLIEIVKMWRHVIKGRIYDTSSLEEHLQKRGVMTRLLKPFLKVVKHSWHMYIIGFLFGLGFDTASEVGLLSISAATGASGIPVGAILLLPLAFTAGMVLIDTLDGIFMLGAYGWTQLNPIRKLYYNMTITFISVIIALFIGSIEAMQVIFSQLKLSGEIIDTIKNINFGNVGYVIIVAFLGSWIISHLVYKVKKYDHLS